MMSCRHTLRILGMMMSPLPALCSAKSTVAAASSRLNMKRVISGSVTRMLRSSRRMASSHRRTTLPLEPKMLPNRQTTNAVSE